MEACLAAIAILLKEVGAILGSIGGFLFLLHEPLMQDLMISIGVEPDGICVVADECVRVHTVDGGFAADADLFAVHEDGHEILFALLFGGALGGGELFLWLGHGDSFFLVRIIPSVCGDHRAEIVVETELDLRLKHGDQESPAGWLILQ